MYSTTSPTVTTFSASASGISRSNSSSNAIISSTISNESAPKSSIKDASVVTAVSATPNCSIIVSFTFSKTSSELMIIKSPPLYSAYTSLPKR